MLFNKIFIEEEVRDHFRTRKILNQIGAGKEIQYIRKVEDIFGRVYRPYRQKDQDLNLFIGKKAGELIKHTPDAYGTATGLHYYFVHQYNCIYACEYCYLQGYFKSPDIVLYLNHEEILGQIRELCLVTNASCDEVWFHAGEFSDSLALSNLTEEWPLYWDVFRTLPNGKLELRTKSANIRSLEGLEPLPNIYISFSLSPEIHARRYEHKVPPIAARIKAMAKLAEAGHSLGIHLDPIIAADGIAEHYGNLMRQVLDQVEEQKIAYVSLGTVRFSKDVFHSLKRNYPDSGLLGQEFITGYDGKIRYFRPLRRQLLKAIKETCCDVGLRRDKIYYCMEEDSRPCQLLPGNSRGVTAHGAI